MFKPSTFYHTCAKTRTVLCDDSHGYGSGEKVSWRIIVPHKRRSPPSFFFLISPPFLMRSSSLVSGFCLLFSRGLSFVLFVSLYNTTCNSLGSNNAILLPRESLTRGVVDTADEHLHLALTLLCGLVLCKTWPAGWSVCLSHGLAFALSCLLSAVSP